MDGKEIAQLYVGLKGSALIRPLKELKGFTKVFLKAGETKKVNIKFDDKTFRYFNTATNKWEIEKGVYDLYVAASIDDVRLVGSINQIGTTNTMPYHKEEDLPHYASGELRNIPDEEFAKLLGHEMKK